MDETFQLKLLNNKQYPYKLTRSQRAKYLRIKITTTGELSVILPNGATREHAHQFLHKKLSWISKTISNISLSEVNQTFPEILDLKLLEQKWKLEYIKSDITSYTLKTVVPNTLIINGNLNDWNVVKQLLNKWCQKQAKQTFKELIEKLAEEYGFHFNKLTIRSQKTRWGSCSNSKNINLNSKLLFMPYEVVRYVVIHELCHTIEMNHSSKFWALVAECDENYKVHRRLLKSFGSKLVL